MALHVIHVVVTSDRTTAELASDIEFTLRQTAEGYIGDPDQHELYGATIEAVA